MRNRTYGGVRGRKTKVGRKLLRFPPTRFIEDVPKLFPIILMYPTKDGAFISYHLLLLV